MATFERYFIDDKLSDGNRRAKGKVRPHASLLPAGLRNYEPYNMLFTNIKYANVDWFMYGWNTVQPGAYASGAQLVAVVPLVAICAYMIWAVLRKEK